MSSSQVFCLQKPKSFEHSIYSLCSSCFLYPDNHPTIILVSTTPALQFVCTRLRNTSALNQSGEQNHAASCSTCNVSEYSYNSLMLQNMMAKVYYSYDSLVNVCLQKGKGFTHTETWAFIASVSYFNPLPFPAYKVSAF